MFFQDLWDVIAWLFWAFVLVAYLMALFSILNDLFRDHRTRGWVKAIWIIFLIFVPFLTAIVYLIARGDGMGRRSQQAATEQRQAAEDYVRDLAGTSSVDQIEKAHRLLDAGAISEEEFAAIKRQALA